MSTNWSACAGQGLTDGEERRSGVQPLDRANPPPSTTSTPPSSTRWINDEKLCARRRDRRALTDVDGHATRRSWGQAARCGRTGEPGRRRATTSFDTGSWPGCVPGDDRGANDRQQVERCPRRFKARPPHAAAPARRRKSGSKTGRPGEGRWGSLHLQVQRRPASPPSPTSDAESANRRRLSGPGPGRLESVPSHPGQPPACTGTAVRR